MRQLTKEEAQSIGLPVVRPAIHPAHVSILQVLDANPGVWYHVGWHELPSAGATEAKLGGLYDDANSEYTWPLDHWVINGYKDGGVFVRRLNHRATKD